MTLNDRELSALAINRIEDRAPKLTNVLHPSSSAIQVCGDKFEFAQMCANLNIPHFNTYLNPLIEYPQICKDRYGSAASGFRVFNDNQTIDEVREVENLVFQKYSTGFHYCVDAYFSIMNHKLIDFCVKKILLKSNGESFIMQSMEPDKFMYLMKLVEASLELRGIVNLDIYEEEGVLRIMEVNTRIGGNYPASHKFGCNLLEHLLRELTEEKPLDVCQSHYRVGVTIAKYFDFVEAT
jgi:predicted ATP-grasp superfamily ATP-dependent carboligase